MGKLLGSVAIITGCASEAGIGFAVARLFHAEGASVVLTDIDEGGVMQRAASLDRQGGRALGLRHDVSREDDWARVVGAAASAFGTPDVLVNNAGISLRETIDRFPLDSWNRVIGINQTGTFLGCKHAMAAMKAACVGGSIVNIASIAAKVAVSMSGAYGSSKAAVRHLTKIVALEGAAAGVRCNAVLPGMILSDIHKPIMSQSPDQHAKLVASIPMARMGVPDDIARAALFFASADAAYVTGAELIVDGGLTVQ